MGKIAVYSIFTEGIGVWADGPLKPRPLRLQWEQKIPLYSNGENGPTHVAAPARKRAWASILYTAVSG